ncbi:hypothetical protein [Gemmatimonas sp.]|jgi:hypothetical protein|uniref:hypothetical protein n=1 Tax=Gemmatimonas sp. TaxID=1962908 RepID=UPI0037BE7124
MPERFDLPMQFTPRPGDPAPRRIRRIGRLVAILGVAVIFIALLWVFTGIPSPVATAMDDAMWAPCPAQYQAARTAVDSGLADGYVLRPRTRFERAITCGSERRRRAAAPR